MRSFALAAAALALAGLSVQVQAAELPDGIYRCELYSGTMIMHLGDINISGSTYQGPLLR